MPPQIVPERSLSRHTTVTHRSNPPPPPLPLPFPPHLQHPQTSTNLRTPAVTSSRVTLSPTPPSLPQDPAKKNLRNRLSTALTTYNELAIPSQALLKLKATPLGELRDYRRIEALPLVALPIIDVNQSTVRHNVRPPPEEPSYFLKTLPPHMRYQSAPSLFQATPSPLNPTVPLT